MTYFLEDDAVHRWCPQARVLYCDEDGSGAGINRRGEISPKKLAPCLGSTCALWRWKFETEAEAEAAGEEDLGYGYCGAGPRPGGGGR